MPIPASGPLSLQNIQTEFGGAIPIGLSEYYAGGGLVPAGTTGTFGAVPSSGAISVRNFYGTSNGIILITGFANLTFQWYGYSTVATVQGGGSPIGSLSPTTGSNWVGNITDLVYVVSTMFGIESITLIFNADQGYTGNYRVTDVTQGISWTLSYSPGEGAQLHRWRVNSPAPDPAWTTNGQQRLIQITRV